MTECQTNGPGTAKTNRIKIVVNGESRLVPPGISLAGLLEFLEVDPARVAVELNRRIVRPPEWSGTSIEAGAELEIVQFVGGG